MLASLKTVWSENLFSDFISPCAGRHTANVVPLSEPPTPPLRRAGPLFPRSHSPSPRRRTLCCGILLRRQQRLKKYCSVLLRIVATCVRHTYHYVPRFLRHQTRTLPPVRLYSTAFSVRLKELVNERVASGQHTVAVMRQRDFILFRQWFEISEYLLDHRGQLNPVVPRRCLQTVHLKKGLCHLRQPLDLLPQKRNLVVSGRISVCSSEKSSICACMSESGVLSSCARRSL